jgi:UTP--glucose-1-phosphate uridylyltransferase
VAFECGCSVLVAGRVTRGRLASAQVAQRTAADKKGGHLAIRKSDGRFMLRESAMITDEDKPHFENIALCVDALTQLPAFAHADGAPL